MLQAWRYPIVGLGSGDLGLRSLPSTIKKGQFPTQRRTGLFVYMFNRS